MIQAGPPNLLGVSISHNLNWEEQGGLARRIEMGNMEIDEAGHMEIAEAGHGGHGVANSAHSSLSGRSSELVYSSLSGQSSQRVQSSLPCEACNSLRNARQSSKQLQSPKSVQSPDSTASLNRGFPVYKLYESLPQLQSQSEQTVLTEGQNPEYGLTIWQADSQTLR